MVLDRREGRWLVGRRRIGRGGIGHRRLDFGIGRSLGGVVREQRTIDPLIDAILAQGWPLKRIEAILRAVLRAGAYELGHRGDVPGRVVVAEYVDVAHAFVDRDETGMINAVLDQLARHYRAGEFARAAR